MSEHAPAIALIYKRIAEKQREMESQKAYIDGLYLAIRILEGTDTPIEARQRSKP